MNRLFIDAIGVATTGMPNWAVASEILCGHKPYHPEPLEYCKPALLPPNEKRRSTKLVRLAFRVCEEILTKNPAAAQNTLSVFASSGGDYQIIDQICRVLAEKDRALSPTQFHNSVHNSAAGYWSIATQSTLPSTSLSGHDLTFAAGLLEAATMAIEAEQPVLLATYDTELPEPLLKKRNIAFPFAVALLLAPKKSEDTIAGITIQRCHQLIETKCVNPDIELLRTGNPAARALPLLERIAMRENSTVILSAPGDAALKLEIEH
ncbi:MAG: beta-ketoacyl synthase chain length factor [Gammaproteobacteria bacterium]|nr:beta-ketoacyl synthase chain length factor [Gammaproteobacteria bacterium]